MKYIILSGVDDNRVREWLDLGMDFLNPRFQPAIASNCAKFNPPRVPGYNPLGRVVLLRVIQPAIFG